MRAVNLAKIGAEAEILRLRHMLKRQGKRAALGLVAVIFALGVLVLAHVAGWQVLQMYVPPIYATLILIGVDLVIAAIFGIVAARSSPSGAERDALAIRQRALHEARNSLALGALIPLAGTLLRTRRNDARKRPFWRRLK
jgi:4-amino-4-deoxy-L-arabinose transferase-like glycosyltransferase